MTNLSASHLFHLCSKQPQAAVTAANKIEQQLICCPQTVDKGLNLGDKVRAFVYSLTASEDAA